MPAYKVKWNEHSMRAKHLMRCIKLWSLLCRVHMMWTTAMLSQRALTVFSTHLWPQVAVAIPTGRSSFTVLYNPYICLRTVEISIIRHTKAQPCFTTFAACCRELRSESSSNSYDLSISQLTDFRQRNFSAGKRSCL